MSGERAGHRAKSLAGQLSVRRNYIRKTLAEVAKLADAPGLGPGSSRSAGSTPALGTKNQRSLCAGFYWCAHVESNHDLGLRRAASYPLNYGRK